jgi:hypothetical protein
MQGLGSSWKWGWNRAAMLPQDGNDDTKDISLFDSGKETNPE